MSDFPAFDYERKTHIELIDGIPTIIGNDRVVIQELGVIEPLDERSDQFVAIPIRRVHTAGSGLAIELGPFCLDNREIITLFNALVSHINDTPNDFKRKAAS